MEFPDKEVNLPEAEASAPIAVELIPVTVVLKCPVVKFRSAPPVVAIEDALRPDNANAPLTPVKLIAPVVRASPLLAVRSPAEVIVPVPVVETLPVVDKIPDEFIDQAVPPVSARVVPAVLLPKTIALALALLPIFRFPVVPESIVNAVPFPDFIDSAPPPVTVAPAAPSPIVVAAPPIFSVVAFALNTVAEALVVVRSPPLTPMSPAVLILNAPL